MGSKQVAERYAQSLYTLAEEQNQLKELHEEMQVLGKLIRESADLEIMLESPILAPLRKGELMKTVLGDQVSALLTHFLDLLAQRNRIELLEPICRAFIEHYNAAHNLAEVRLRSAVELDESLRKTLIDKLESSLGVTALVDYQVDASLLGGFVLELEDRYLDASLSTDLNQIRQAFQEPDYTASL